MWFNRIYLLIFLLGISLCGFPRCGYTVQVNDDGVWKEPNEVLINDSGTWKVVQQIHVNDSGTWTLAYNVTLPDGNKTLTFSWDITDPQYINPGFPDRTNSTAYNVGDRVTGPLYPGIYAEVVVAGTTSTNPDYLPFLSVKHLQHGGVVIDNGDGTVTIPAVATNSLDPGQIFISGTENYNGSFYMSLLAEDGITITAPFIPETIFSGLAIKTSGDGTTAADGTVVWKMKDYASDITGYKLYFNDQLLCSATGKTAMSLTCNDIPFTTPASFHMTYIHARDGESEPSNTITYQP